MYYVQLTNGVEIISDKPFNFAPDGRLMNGNAMFWKGNEPVQNLSFKSDSIFLSWTKGINVINDFPEAIPEEPVEEIPRDVDYPEYPLYTGNWCHVAPNPGEVFLFGKYTGETLESKKDDVYTPFYVSVKLNNGTYRKHHGLNTFPQGTFTPQAYIPEGWTKGSGVNILTEMPMPSLINYEEDLPF
jgi:hypothetical protein